MEIKILQVFYGKDGLPYKDQERTIHFPIVGNGFQGASNTTKIRFYYGELGDSATSWVATSKLPNGKIGSKVLSTYLDSDLDESYALLELSSFYFQYKGDVFISLQGYEGGVQVEYDSVHEIYKVVGTPTIQATGSIKLSVNYATQFIGSGEESNVDMQELLALVGEKANDDEVVHKAGTETITGAKTFSGNVFFGGVAYAQNQFNIDGYSGNGKLNLSYTYLTTNSKGYFARVGVTTNHYVYYDLPKNYNDLGSEQHLTLATEDYVDNAITSSLGDIYKIKGSKTVAQLNALTLDSSMVGDVYNVTDSGTLTAGDVYVSAGDNVVVIEDDGSYIFDKMSASVEAALEDYYTKTEINTLLSGKVTYTGEVGTKTVGEFFTQYGTGAYIIQLLGSKYLLSVSTAIVGETNTQLFMSAMYLGGDFEIAQVSNESFANSTSMYNMISNFPKKYPLTCREFNTSNNVVYSIGIDKPCFFKISGDSYGYTFVGSVSRYTISQDSGLYSWQIEIECLNNANRWVASYSGSSPSLTFADVMSNTYLHIYEDASNKVTSLSGSSTDTQYPSAKCVYDNLQDIREVAEGKCSSFVLSCAETVANVKSVIGTASGQPKAYMYFGLSPLSEQAPTDITQDILDGDYDSVLIRNSLFNDDSDSLSLTSGATYPDASYLILQNGMNYWFIQLSPINNIDFAKLGDVFYVVETDVPDRWWASKQATGSVSLYKLETALANYVTLNSAQTITGVKTFSNGFFVGNYANDYISIANGDFFIRGTNSIVLRSGNNNILPYSNNSTDLGSSSYAWKDLYLSGKINLNASNSTTITTNASGEIIVDRNGTTIFNFGNTNGQANIYYDFVPILGNNNKLGSSTKTWKNLYLSGILSNGTESYNIQDSYNLLFGKYTENNAMTELGYTQYCIIQLSANRIFTLKSAPYGCFPEYHFKVENTSSSAITLTFPNNTVILTNDEDNVVVSSNTISLAGNTTIECSLVGLNLVAINFEVQ